MESEHVTELAQNLVFVGEGAGTFLDKTMRLEAWVRTIAAEATAAFRARVRAQAVHFEGAWWECRLCGSAWSDEEEDDAMPQEERHNVLHGQPCAAQETP
jgi:hypothetical protein